MDDFDLDYEDDPLLGELRKERERRRSFHSSSESLEGTPEALEGEWSEWMCPVCGRFMKPEVNRCKGCDWERV